MSEFIAEAAVRVRPDTRTFRKELSAQLAAIKVAPVVVPVVAAGAGLAAAAAATAALSTQQAVAEKTTLGLASAAQVESSAFGRQAVILQAASASTAAVAANQERLRVSSNKTTGSLLGLGSATGRLDAALLGLRTAVGSTAVIGLGAGALAAIALGKGLRSLIGSTAQLERELNVFQATTGATALEMENVSEAATRLGADITIPGVSAGDAAVAMSELAKAGLSVQQSIDAARGVLQLATAASIDFAAASELAANALNAFGLDGADAVHVADLLAGASIAAQGSISDMGFALSQTAAVARQVGFTVEATTTILALLAKNGLRGSDAGTSLRTALLRLVNPSAEAARQIQELGLQVRDFAGNIRTDIFAQFGAATRDLSAAQRDAVLANVFGQDAIRAAAILAREGVEGFAETEAVVRKQGAAAELAGAKSKGLAGAWENLKNQATNAGLAIGNDLNPLIEAGVSGTADILKVTNDFSDALDNLGKQPPPQSVEELTTQLQNLQSWLSQFAAEGDKERVARLRERIEELAAALREQMNPALFENADALDRAALSTRTLSDAHDRMVDSATAAAGAIDLLTRATAQNQAELLRLQTEGGTPQQQIAVLRSDIATQRDIIARAKAGPAKGRATAIEKARRQILSDQAQIEALQAQITSDARTAASKAETAAKEAQAANDRQFQALADMFGGRQQRLEDAIARAAIADNVAKQIRLNKALIASLKKERVALLERLKTLKVSATLRKQILDAIARAIEDAQQDVLRLQKEQQDAFREAVSQKLDLRIQLAEVRGDIKGQIRAHRAKLKAIQAELEKLRRQHKQNTVAWLELKVQQAEEQKAIKELQAQTKEKNRAQAALMFTFLQTQQGFAANLLGNLIGGGLTGGLVGNTSATGTAAPTAVSAFGLKASPGRALNPEADLVAQGQVAAGARLGVSRGQGTTQVELLRSILQALNDIKRGAGFPGAQYQRRRASAAMDTGGGGGGVVAA